MEKCLVWFDLIVKAATLFAAFWVPIKVKRWTDQRSEIDRENQKNIRLKEDLLRIRERQRQLIGVDDKNFELTDEFQFSVEKLEFIERTLRFELSLVENALSTEICQKASNCAKFMGSPWLGSIRIMKDKYGEAGSSMFHLARISALISVYLHFLADPSTLDDSELLRQEGVKRIAEAEKEYFNED